jgi:hypothetical protein
MLHAIKIIFNTTGSAFSFCRTEGIVIFVLKRAVMKRKLILGVFLLFIAWAFTSCEALNDCGYCKEVIYEDNDFVSETTETEFCGADLIKKKATPPVTVGSLTTKVECR